MQGSSKQEAKATSISIAARARELAGKVEQLKAEIGVECDEIRVHLLKLATKQAELDRVQRDVVQLGKDARHASGGGW